MEDEKKQLIEDQLGMILVSKYFRSAKQMKRFLTYIVEKTIKGKGEKLKQYTIGIEALLLTKDFDPDENPSVRILGGRVRQRLNEYYEEDRNEDKIIISLSKGSYIPEFHINTHIRNNVNSNQYISRGPRLALVSFTDRTQNENTNRILLQCTDTLAIELSRFMVLKLIVCNPYGDKEQSHLLESEMKVADRADYILAIYFQEINDHYRLVYRLVLVDTGEILWSENYGLTGPIIDEQEFIIGKITATVADHLQGMMHTHWSRTLLNDIDYVPLDSRVLVYFRNYTDLFNRGAFAKSVNACLEALERNPNDVIANVIYAALCRREYVFGYGVIESALEKASKSIDVALRLTPNSHEAHYVHGLILFCQNEWELCAEEFDLARSISKFNMVTEFGVGFHFCKMDQWEKGLPIVKNAMLLSNYYPSYYHIVPFLDFFRKENYKRALHEARKISTPGLIHGPVTRCVSYAYLGEPEKAKEELREVLVRFPNVMEIGREYSVRVLGSKVLAKKIWDTILEVNKGLDD